MMHNNNQFKIANATAVAEYWREELATGQNEFCKDFIDSFIAALSGVTIYDQIGVPPDKLAALRQEALHTATAPSARASNRRS